MAWTEQIKGLLVVLGTISMTFADYELGPPISPDEFAAALADPTLTAPTPEGADNLEYLEQQTDTQQARYFNWGFVEKNYWGNGTVPYTIHSVYTARDRQKIALAIAEFENKTCIRFVPRTTQRDYIFIYAGGERCTSSVGRVGGMQRVTLPRYSCMSERTIRHELMHALGFTHEHLRPDRDQYITMHSENFALGAEFTKKGDSVFPFMSKTYDYYSVMHYLPSGLSSNGQPVFTSKKEGIKFSSQVLTELDLIGINLLYGCEDPDTVNNSKNCMIFEEYNWCKMKTEYMCQYCANTCKQCVSGCEMPWVAIENSGCFLFENWQLNWDMSRKYCMALGADLAVIDTMAKRNDILDYMTISKNLGNIWVGATDRSGSWQWLNGNNVTDGWETGYPDRDTGNDTCMKIGNNRDTDFLRDWPCFNTPAKVLCHKYDESNPAVCDPSCVNGLCIAHNICECDQWWKSPTCEEFFCEAGCQNGGTCSGPNECTCPPYTAGLYCEETYCDSVCLNGGKCTGPNPCTCPKGFTGSLCEISVCEDLSKYCVLLESQCTDKTNAGDYVNKNCPKTCKKC